MSRARGQRRRAGAAGGRRERLAAGVRHHQAVAVDSLLRMLHEPASTLITWGVIGVALALPLCLFLLLVNLQQLGPGLDRAAGISVYMAPESSADELQNFRETLLARADVRDVAVITREEALAEFRRSSGFGQALQGLEENPLPPVLEVTPATAEAGEDGFAALRETLEALPGAEQVQLDLQWVQRLTGIINLAERVALWLAGLLGVAVVLVVGNTVRLAIAGRQREIVVIKLVGGTDAYVARPFLYTGLWFGVGGGLVALLVVALSLLGLRGPVATLAGLYGGTFTLRGVDLADALLILAGSGALGWVGARLAVHRHLKRIEPQ